MRGGIEPPRTAGRWRAPHGQYGNAYALLEALAIEPDSVGDIPIDLLRARLSDPATPSRAALRGVGHYLPRLERLVASAQEREAARFAWA